MSRARGSNCRDRGHRGVRLASAQDPGRQRHCWAHSRMSTPTVGRTILSRWLAVLALVGIWAVTAHLVVPWGWEFARAMQAPQSVNRVALHAAVWLLWMGVGFAVARFELVRLRHLRHMRRYPPLWLALPLSASVLWLGHRCFPSLPILFSGHSRTVALANFAGGNRGDRRLPDPGTPVADVRE